MLTCGLLLAGGSGADQDPVVGTWRLNVGRSQVSTAATEAVTRTYESVTQGVRVSETRTDEHGAKMLVQFVTQYDGKEYPVWISADGGHVPVTTNETIAMRRLDGRTAEGTGRENGQIKYRFRRTVSQDGQHLSVEITDTNTPDARSRSVLVYDRVNAHRQGRASTAR